MSRELLTPAEVQMQLSISRWTLWRMVRAGKLAPYNAGVGRSKRFHISDIRRLKAARMVQVGADGCKAFPL